MIWTWQTSIKCKMFFNKATVTIVLSILCAFSYVNYKNIQKTQQEILKVQLINTDEQIQQLFINNSDLMNTISLSKSTLTSESLATAINYQQQLHYNYSQASQLAKRNKALKEEQSWLLHDKKELGSNLEAIKLSLIELRNQFSQSKQQKSDVETLIAQQQTIMALSEHRSRLQPDQPCPLCGSEQHPAISEYQSINVDVQQQRLYEINEQLNQLETQGRNLAKQETQLDTELNNKGEREKNITIELAKLSSDFACLNLPEKVSFEITDGLKIEHVYHECGRQIDLLNNFQIDHNHLIQQKVESEQQLQQIVQLLAQVKHQQAMVNEKVNHCLHGEKEQKYAIEQLVLEQNNTKSTLFNDVNATQISQFIGHSNDAFSFIESHDWLKQINDMVLVLEQKSSQSQTYSTQLSAIENTNVLVTEQVSQLQKQVKALSEQTNALNNQIIELNRLRVTELEGEVFNGFDCQSIEYIREKIITKASSLTANVILLQKAQQERDGKLQLLLGQKHSVKQQLLELNKTQVEADESLNDIIKQCQEDEKKLTSLSLDNIESVLININEQLKQQQVSLGQTQQIISHNQQSKIEQQAVLQQIALEQKSVDQLAYLNTLIGSADGAKFRKFAQSLTLNNLVQLANEQLNKLDGRYQLQCQQSDSLSLEVLDTWQGDSIRDTKTLSGGESFLVSLALALALSDLVSNKTSIDSLFLDEGFGTLDNDTLEIALVALDHLNASGKMIGIISHVEALKDRIDVQIKVEKQSGLGVSTLDKKFAFSES